METFVTILVLAFIGWMILRAKVRAAMVLPPAEKIAGEGAFDQEVVGEASYQRDLRGIAGPGSVRLKCEATLDFEDDNPHDKKAVRVDINGKTVGYLSRQDARKFRKKYGASGASYFSCAAVVVGGGEGRESLGVWLDVP